MKIIISIISIFVFLINSALANSNVTVSAVIWNINSAPLILSVNPSSSLNILEEWESQVFIINIRDIERDTLYYTITPENGYVNPISWIIESSEYNSEWETSITFTYLAPVPAPSWNYDKVTVTISDWPNVVVRDINFYIF